MNLETFKNLVEEGNILKNVEKSYFIVKKGEYENGIFWTLPDKSDIRRLSDDNDNYKAVSLEDFELENLKKSFEELVKNKKLIYNKRTGTFAVKVAEKVAVCKSRDGGYFAPFPISQNWATYQNTNGVANNE